MSTAARSSRASRKQWLYLVTFLVLVVLAALSLGLSYLSLGAWEMPVAMVIAGGKATLVGLFFMELVEESFVMRLVVVTILAFVVLLISFMVLDVLTRFDAGIRPPVPLASR